jgi:hypothetical protein
MSGVRIPPDTPESSPDKPVAQSLRVSGSNRARRVKVPSIKIHVLMVWYGRISRPEDSRPRYRREYIFSLGTEGILRDKSVGGVTDYQAITSHMFLL